MKTARSSDSRPVPEPDNREAPAGDAGESGVDFGRLPRHVGYALRRAQLAVFADFITTLEQVDLRPGEFSVLTLIAQNPGIVARRICAALGIQPANFVGLCSRLEARQIIRRVAIDRRSSGLYLTPKGRTLFARAQLLSDQHEARIAAKIGARECGRLIELLFRIAALDGAGPGTPAAVDDASRRAALPRTARKKR